jgi:hypothetical protein
MLEDDLKKYKLLFSSLIYENLMPEDHFYRKLEACIEKKRIDTICRHLYKETGQHSVNSGQN